jgi:hypothetical protein
MVTSELDGEKKAAVKVSAVGSNRINLVVRIGRLAISVTCATKRVAANGHNAVAQGRKLALKAHESFLQSQDEVTATALGHWAIYLDPKLDCSENDCLLGNRSLLVRCHIRQRSRRIGWAMS